MTIKYNKVNTLWQGATWFKRGWQLFKKQPLTWLAMVVMFTISSVLVSSFTVGQYIVALFSPVFVGGMFLTMDKSSCGQKAQLEGLFSAFKHRPTLKQLLIIGSIGIAVMALISLFESMPGSDYMLSGRTGRSAGREFKQISLGAALSQIVMVPWMLAVVFAIPLVAIKHHKAVPALKNSLWVAVMHLTSIVPFVLMAALLLFLALLPAGLGVLLWLPVLFCSVYSAFAMIYSGPAQEVERLGPVIPIENARSSKQSAKRETTTAAPLSAQEHIGRALSKADEDIKQREQRPAVDMEPPEQLGIQYFDDYICITRHWFSARAMLPIACALLAIGASYLVFSGKMNSTNFVGEQWFIDLLPWLFPVLAVVSSYSAMARCLNRTEIYVGDDTIEIRHRPLPWFGNKRLQTSNIKQLYVAEETRVVNQNSGRTRQYYHLQVVPVTGEKYSLLRSFETKEPALFIEQELEKFLHIHDQPVHEVVGEVVR